MLVIINGVEEIEVLIDSGASSNFMHQETAEKLGLELQDQREPQPVEDIQGKPLGWINKYVRVHIRVLTHQEAINFNIILLGVHKLVLGLPWLQKHDPEIKWTERKIRFNSPFCKTNCIRKAFPKLAKTKLTEQILEEDKVKDMTLNNIQEYPIEHHKSGQGGNLLGVPIEYHNFADVFDLKEARMMPAERGIWNFKIDFIEGWEDKLPRVTKRYQLMNKEQKLEEETIKELLEAGMICPSMSPIAAPCFFVPKKDRMKCHVVDWQGINAITIGDAHPLPIMDNLLDLVKGSKIMSKLDLTASYNQIPIREQDRWKTAFISSLGLFEFNIMHFGFKNAPAHMQRFMQHTLSPVYHKTVRVYLDNIPVFSQSKENHIETMKRVLQLLRENKLFAKAKKCEFHKMEMELLGVKVTTKGFEMEDKKVTEVQQWKPPKNIKGIRSFLGFCNFYQRFIKNFSIIARPLHDLKQKNYPWRWTGKEQTAFDTLKTAVTSKPVLNHVNQILPFRMEMDASNTAYGAVLSQKQPEEPRHPVAYMLKSMTALE